MNKPVLKIFCLVLFTIYPFVIYFFLKNNYPIRGLALLIMGLAFLHFTRMHSYLLLTLGITLGTGLAILDNPLFLKLYPVVMNTGVSCLFFGSLTQKPLITCFAEKMGHKMTGEAILYTRRVTCAWGVFMAVISCISLLTVFMGDFIWTLYNGFISYILIGCMFGVEFLIRRRMHV